MARISIAGKQYYKPINHQRQLTPNHEKAGFLYASIAGISDGRYREMRKMPTSLGIPLNHHFWRFRCQHFRNTLWFVGAGR